MRNWLLIGLLSAVSCDSFLRNNPDYCVDDSQCTTATICNSSLHHCEPGTVGPVVLTAITPNMAALAGGDTVVLTGMNFRTGATVTFNGVAATQVQVRSSTELSVVVPKVSGMCGPATVAVTNPGATAVTSSTLLKFKFGVPEFTPVPGGLPSTPSTAHGIQAVDFDVDGQMDLAVLNSSGHELLVYKGNGDLSFSLINTGFPLDSNSTETLFVKANSDSYPDLISWDSVGLSLYVNLAGVGLTVSNMISGSIVGVTVGSVNGTNTQQDLITTDNAIAQLAIRLAEPSGAGAPYSGAASSLALSEKSKVLLVGKFEKSSQFNAIVAAQPNTASAAIYFGQAASTFSAKQTISLGIQAVQLAAVDLDKDGNKDLVSVGGLGSAQGLSAVYGDGNRGFSTPTATTSIGGNPTILATGDSGFDFDCDGRPDIVLYLQDASSLLIYLNNVGGRAIGTPVTIPVGNAVDSLAVTDLDGDGKPDIALITKSMVMLDRSSVILHNTSH